ncbi:hypothetical protein J437_LFUL011770 [Ladona fulva]|uniref:Putative inositol monophosphatase 3 n=1 Tax=Ladona fulva TaxID=123851 RepID=A0A8K0KBH8_LADFU|nr:hypothetical protein J437_LFUL011770 [Ladona fulva]
MNLGGTIRLNPLGVCVLIGGCVLIFVYMNFWTSDDISREVSPPDEISLKKLLGVAINAAVLGGEEVRRVNGLENLNQRSKGKTDEGANDPVTDADFLSHCVMLQTLTRAFPNIKIISEEKPRKKCEEAPSVVFDENQLVESYSEIEDMTVKPEDVTVWIDPLDATQEFIEKLLQYVTTMVCVAVKGLPTIGVIHQPFKESKTYWAWVGHSKSPSVKSQVSPQRNIIVSRSHAGEVKNISQIAFGSDIDVTSAGGAGYKVLEVINGNASAYVHVTAIKKWDICAGDALLRSVGGNMTKIDGHELDYSAKSSQFNRGGLIATLQDHLWFIERLQKFYSNEKLSS